MYRLIIEAQTIEEFGALIDNLRTNVAPLVTPARRASKTAPRPPEELKKPKPEKKPAGQDKKTKDDPVADTRTCALCQETKPIVEYRPHARGHSKTCIDCEPKKCAECGKVLTPSIRNTCTSCGTELCGRHWRGHTCQELK
jgi:hypothetical protein